ncbi:MAG: hypothetical protein JWL95_2238 [Gemmatimonadetes bacterium]|nr:hypothetical protein [Gemmatimonadota bacterium]
MLALYGSDARQLARMRQALPVSECVVASDDWHSFEQAVPSAACAVIWMEYLADQLTFSRLSLVRHRFPRQPVVLITQKDADNLRHVLGLSIAGVVWSGELPRGLCSAVQRALVHSLFGDLADAFASAEQLPGSLRHSLSYACRSERPIRSVGALAAASCSDRCTLWRHWRKAVGAGAPARLEDALHWLVLLRAVGRKSPHQAWGVVAHELGVHHHTLSRLARRLASRRLSDLGASDLPDLTALFVRDVLRPLVGDNADSFG